MRHLGDITKLSGFEVEPVDCIIGGSPCTNISSAGNRKGLGGAESVLFLEQIRVVKEMREADRRRGRAGVFVRPRYMVWENVSNIFKCNGGADFQRVLQEVIRIAEPEAPDVPLPAKWPLADAWYGDGWSVSYRVLDAQFWGVPQRRRRIALVVDFGGLSAPEILFERKGSSWDTEQCGETGKAPSSGAGGDAAPAGGAVFSNDALSAGFLARATGKARGIGYEVDRCPTLVTGEAPYILCDNRAAGPFAGRIVRKMTPLEEERAQGFPDGWTDLGDWTDSRGKLRHTSDAARYRALGNSIALPPWKWVLKRLCANYGRDATMASLFDGIAGFPLLWTRLNGLGSVRWTSEIDEFPSAVCRRHFGDELTGEEGDYGKAFL